ncbi:hypothetical protein GRJ2_002350400 [Grus japonensis]|uniref:Uncharacterized protein n=1 Tax=Grus japonensis TaxID=30415 RepID=A0ABC9XMD2_GRUJA
MRGSRGRRWREDGLRVGPGRDQGPGKPGGGGKAQRRATRLLCGSPRPHPPPSRPSDGYLPFRPLLINRADWASCMPGRTDVTKMESFHTSAHILKYYYLVIQSLCSAMSLNPWNLGAGLYFFRK